MLTTFAFSVDPKMVDDIRALAAQEGGRSMSSVIRAALAGYLASTPPPPLVKRRPPAKRRQGEGAAARVDQGER
jgi:hypothetical protein